MSEYYPPVSFYFSVSFTGISDSIDSAFQEVSGFNAEISYREIKEGGENRFTHRVPEDVKFSNLILKRGIVTKGSALAAWCQKVVRSDFAIRVEPKDITVCLLDENKAPLKTWNFKNAYPVKWSISDFKASGNDIAVETLEFSYSYFEIK